ncbi:AtpZ/AtpI family protein [Ancylobacter terrae]|uniref:AtpZ/AtpI family protein n=1 Tax=Ancylobacter sp. sgz301288 TaxID=3342077 RepID=UPI00385BAA12
MILRLWPGWARIMNDRKSTDGQDGRRAPAEDAELSGRLRGLDKALRQVRRERSAQDAPSGPDPASTSSGVTLAFRLGSEFVAAVLVGAGLGWGLDRLLGIAPWGMILFMLLGFAAGILNMVRAAGETGGRKPPQGGA